MSNPSEPQRLKLKTTSRSTELDPQYVTGLISARKETAESPAPAQKPAQGLLSFIPTGLSSIPGYNMFSRSTTKNEPLLDAAPFIIKNVSIPDLTAEEEEDLFLLARLEKSRKLTGSNANLRTTATWLGEQFSTTLKLFSNDKTSDSDPNAVDWDFWGDIINNYEAAIRKNPRHFTDKLHKGIPEAIRGM